MKRILSLLLTVLLLFGRAAAQEEPEQKENGAFPELNAQGFLDEGEFVWADADNGDWRYCSQTLKVEIYRRSTAKPKRIWYEAEIWSGEGEAFRMIPWETGNKRWASLAYPYKIARANDTVFAINGDFAHLRIQQKLRVGFLIRDGEIISQRSYPKNKQKVFPNLDTLALFADGDMRVFWSDEIKIEEYGTMGAVDVLSFGPWLIRDGELNKTGIKRYGTSTAQRTGIGMVEKGHYFAVTVEGRHKGSKGCSVAVLAQILLDLGCRTAFNLDGGQSAAMIFMGKQLCFVPNKHGRAASARKAAEILGIGTSEMTAAPEDPF